MLVITYYDYLQEYLVKIDIIKQEKICMKMLFIKKQSSFLFSLSSSVKSKAITHDKPHNTQYFIRKLQIRLYNIPKNSQS